MFDVKIMEKIRNNPELKPSRYWGLSFDMFNGEGIKGIIKEIEKAVEAGRWIILSGQSNGCGKASLAVARLKRNYEKLAFVIYDKLLSFD